MSAPGSNVSVRFDALNNLTPVLKTMTGSLDGFKTTVTNLKGQFQQLNTGTFTGALGNFSRPFEQAGQKVSEFRTRLSQIGQTLSSNATSFGVATASIWGVYNAYDSLTKVQIRANAAAVRVSTLTTSLHSQEERLRIAKDKGNLTNEQVIVLEQRIADTREKLNVATERSADIAQDVQEAWAGFFSTVGPQVVAAGASIVQLGTALKGSFKDSGGFINALKGAFTGLFPSLRGTTSEALLLSPALGGIGPKAEQAGGKLSGLKNILGGLGASGALLIGGLAALGGFFVALGVDIINTNRKMADFDAQIKVTAKGTVESFQLMADKWKTFNESLGGQVSGFIAQSGLSKIVPFGNITEMRRGATQWAQDSAQIRADLLKVWNDTMASPEMQLLGSLPPATQAQIKKNMSTMLSFIRTDVNWEDVAHFETATGIMQPIAKGINQALTVDLPTLISTGKVDISGMLMSQFKDVKKFADVVVQDLGGAFKAAQLPTGVLDLGIKTLVSTIVDAHPELAGFGALIESTAKDIIKSSQSVDTTLEQSFANITKSSDSASEQYAKDSLKRITADKLWAAGQISTQEASNLTFDQLQLLDKAYGENSDAIEKLSGTTLGLTGSIGDSISSFLDAKIAAIDYTAALTDMNLQNRLVQQGTLAGLEQADEFFKNLVKETEQQNVFNASLAEGASMLGIHSNLLAFSSGKMQDLLKTTYATDQAFAKLALDGAKNTKWLNDNALMSSVLMKAMTDGRQAANDWTVSMIASTQAAMNEHEQLVRLAAEMIGPFVGGAAMTTDELHKLMTTFQETGSKAAALQAVFDEKLRPSFVALSSVFEATNMKGIRDALKGIELPKGLRKSADEILEPLQKIAEHGRKAAGAFNVIIAAGDTMTKKEYAKWLGGLHSELKKIGDTKGVGKPIDDIITAIGKMSVDELEQHADSIRYLLQSTAADSPGGPKVNKQEQLTFLEKWRKEVKLAGNNAEDAAPGVNTFTTAIVATGSALKQIMEADAAFDATKSRFAPSRTVPKDITVGPRRAPEQAPTKATLDISEATKNITRLIGNFNGWLNVAATVSVAQLKIDTATKSITRLIGNFSGWFNLANTANPGIKANPSPATSSITRVIGNFNGWFNRVNSANPGIKANPVPATQAITRVIGNFQGWLNKINSANPAIKANNSDAMSKINAVKNALNGLKDKTVTVHVNVQQSGSLPKARGGLEYRTTPTNTLWGEAGPEIAAFFPLRTPGAPRKGDYDIVVPTPNIDTSGIRNALGNIGPSAPSVKTGPIHLTIPISVYLTQGLPAITKFVREIVLEDLGMFPST